MTDLDLLLKGAVFVLEIFALVFGSLFLVLLAAAIVVMREGRE